MSDLENELLGLAEDDPHRRSKKRTGSGAGNGPVSKAYIDDSDEEGGAEEDDGEEGEDEMEDMDMDLESEEDEDEAPAPPPPRPVPVSIPVPKASTSTSRKKSRTSELATSSNPYPLEGKYIDEDDRDELDAMPEIERENILASRLEEMQKIKDRLALNAMFKSAGMGGDEDDESDEEPTRKKRKHTSVTKEASRAIKELKSKRKAGDERAARRAARREAKGVSSRASDGHSTEDGEISNDEYSFRRARDDSPGYRPSASSSSIKKSEDKSEEMDAFPPSCVELNSARLSRYEIVDMCYKDGFELVAKNSFVRLMAGEPDELGRPKYRCHRIVEIDSNGTHGRYSIEYKGRNVLDNRALMCQYGKVKRLFRIADVSNGDFEETEFQRFSMTNTADKVKMPRRSELQKKHEEIKALRERPMSNEEVNRQIQARKKSNPLAQRSQTIVAISQLISSRDLALRRNDQAGADSLNQQILELGGDPQTGELLGRETHSEAYDEKIRMINENNRKKTKEAMAAAHRASMLRKKAEDAFVKARSQGNSPAPETIPKTVVPPVSGLKKGETPQKYVARKIELDLGDF